MDTENFDFESASLHEPRIDSVIGVSEITGTQEQTNDNISDEGDDEEFATIEDLENANTGCENSSSILETPSGSIYWVPIVDSEYKPVVGTIFSSFENAKKLYDEYASRGGFDTRLSTTKKLHGVVTHRYIVCNRHRKSRKKDVDSLEGTSTSVVERKRAYKVTNCMASVRLKAVAGTCGYRLYEFNEKHNHPLMDAENMDLSKARRRLQYSDQQYIHRLSKSNIGPSVAYELKVLENGGYENDRGMVKDYNTFRRDVKLFIGERDAHMIVDKMVNKQNHMPNYSFNYKVVDSDLTSMFWADKIAKINYEAFGDVIAFDATYKTNM